MIINASGGMEFGMDATAKTYTNLTAAQTIEVPITVTAFAVFLKTSAGGEDELCAYYRTDQDGAYTMRVSSGGTASTRLHTDLGDALLLTFSGGTTAQPASLEVVALGAKV